MIRSGICDYGDADIHAKELQQSQTRLPQMQPQVMAVKK